MSCTGIDSFTQSSSQLKAADNKDREKLEALWYTTKIDKHFTAQIISLLKAWISWPIELFDRNLNELI